MNTYGQARTRLARLLNAGESEIALTDNTGEGMNIVTYGLNWREGDEVITTNHEHISALAPLYQIRDRYGVTIRIADLGPKANAPLLDTITPLLTERTRLIILSHVTWTNGVVLDVSAVTRLGRERGIPVLIDGAQSVGNIRLDMKALDVDFYAMPIQKWLCGPDGNGALYINSRSRHLIQPTYVGYMSVKHDPGIEWALEDDARCFELGGRQSAALAGQAAVLDWLENTVGHDWLFPRILSLATYAYNALSNVPGLEMLTPEPGKSGLISFTLANKKDDELVKTLSEQHNILLRNIPSIHAIRISTGFYNTEEEIDTLVNALKSM
jgi:L-cysteine/cystine lyase